MHTDQKILLPFADLLGQETLEKRTHFLELKSNCVHWVYEAWVNYRVDDGDPWHERLLSYDWTVRRESITFVELSYTEKPEYWKIILWAQGTESDIQIYYKKEESARELLKVLNGYIFS